MKLIEFFTDPVLRAPTLGSMLMCLASSLVGVLVFLRKRSLLGEALSHASYPGVVVTALLLATFFPFSEELLSIGALVGALIFALIAMGSIEFLERRLRVSSDAALCFVLSVFFGVGVLLSSRMQMSHSLWYKQVQLFLYGQAATLTDAHVWLYGLLALLVSAVLFFFYPAIGILHFDRGFAKSIRMATRALDGLLVLLLALAIVVGLRCVGVVLMSAMLIAPAVAARQFSKHLYSFFFFAALFGMSAGFLGSFLSIEFPRWIGEPRLPLPTGPMIVLVAAIICLVTLLFAPRRGLVLRWVRIGAFRLRCHEENLLKALYKERFTSPSPIQSFLLWRMQMKKWVEKSPAGETKLSEEGSKRARKLIRIHRLWEAYLVYMGQGVEKVHRSAEEMEHILTPEIEKELGELLQYPEVDPHKQPIPKV